MKFPDNMNIENKINNNDSKKVRLMNRWTKYNFNLQIIRLDRRIRLKKKNHIADIQKGHGKCKQCLKSRLLTIPVFLKHSTPPSRTKVMWMLISPDTMTHKAETSIRLWALLTNLNRLLNTIETNAWKQKGERFCLHSLKNHTVVVSSWLNIQRLKELSVKDN